MAKKITSICLDPEIMDHINEQKKEYSFDFSAWVNETYRFHFLSIEGIVKQIEKRTNEIDELKNRLKKAKESALEVGKLLNRNEINFVLKVPILIKEGKDWMSICRRFNYDFNRGLDLSEFQQLVREFDEDRKKKLEDKFEHLRRKKVKK